MRGRAQPRALKKLGPGQLSALPGKPSQTPHLPLEGPTCRAGTVARRGLANLGSDAGPRPLAVSPSPEGPWCSKPSRGRERATRHPLQTMQTRQCPTQTAALGVTTIFTDARKTEVSRTVRFERGLQKRSVCRGPQPAPPHTHTRVPRLHFPWVPEAWAVPLSTCWDGLPRAPPAVSAWKAAAVARRAQTALGPRPAPAGGGVRHSEDQRSQGTSTTARSSLDAEAPGKRSHSWSQGPWPVTSLPPAEGAGQPGWARRCADQGAGLQLQDAPPPPQPRLQALPLFLCPLLISGYQVGFSITFLPRTSIFIQLQILIFGFLLH